MKTMPDYLPTLGRRREEFAKIIDSPKFLMPGDVYSYPNWPGIVKLVKARVLKPEQTAAMDEIVFAWLQNLCAELGGGYRVNEHQKILLLSNLDEVAVHKMMLFLEQAVSDIRSLLGGCAWKDAAGYEVILLFEEEDDYEDFIAEYFPEWDRLDTHGIFVKASYTHIAVSLRGGVLPKQILGHELTHSALCRYRLPLWLNEGIAKACQRFFTKDSRLMPLSQTMVARHYEFWTPQTIQRFWVGVSFRTPGEAELSYSLALILFQWLQDKKHALPAFIEHANPLDAGQTAALDHLGVCLGKVAGLFLGEGDWRPNLKMMAQIRAAQAKGNASEKLSA